MLILDNSSCLSDLQIPGEDDLEDAEKDGLGCQWCAHKTLQSFLPFVKYNMIGRRGIFAEHLN